MWASDGLYARKAQDEACRRALKPPWHQTKRAIFRPPGCYRFRKRMGISEPYSGKVDDPSLPHRFSHPLPRITGYRNPFTKRCFLLTTVSRLPEMLPEIVCKYLLPFLPPNSTTPLFSQPASKISHSYLLRMRLGLSRPLGIGQGSD